MLRIPTSVALVAPRRSIESVRVESVRACVGSSVASHAAPAPSYALLCVWPASY